MRRLLGFGLLLLDVGLIAAFLIAYVARYVPPWHLWWAELFAIAMPYLCLLVAAGLIVWLLARRWTLAACHAALMVLVLVRFVPVTWLSPPTERPDDLVVLTFNLPRAESVGSTPGRQEATLRRLLTGWEPDLAAFQEAAHLFGLLGEQGVRLARAGEQAPIYHFATPPGTTRPWNVGQPVLTHVKTGDVDLIYLQPRGDRDDDLSYVLRTEFEWQGRKAVHYNVHLQSFRLAPTTPQSLKALSPRSWILRVLTSKQPIIERGREAQKIREMIEQETLPVILTGDFNSTAHSWTFHEIAAGFTDAFQTAGEGWGATFHARFPFARIDFILAGPEWEVVSADVPNVRLSDHRPVVARLRWR